MFLNKLSNYLLHSCACFNATVFYFWILKYYYKKTVLTIVSKWWLMNECSGGVNRNSDMYDDLNLNTNWPDEVTNVEVLSWTGMIKNMLCKSQLRWTSHTDGTSNEQLLKIILWWAGLQQACLWWAKHVTQEHLQSFSEEFWHWPWHWENTVADNWVE